MTTSVPSRRARTCRASRRWSTRSSARSCWARAASRLSSWPSTSPSACASARIRGVIEQLGGLRADAFVSARQENLETIHQHNVVAERFGMLDELRRELDEGWHFAHHTTMREWLDAAG
jgi:hypothetical protein